MLEHVHEEIEIRSPIGLPFPDERYFASVDQFRRLSGISNIDADGASGDSERQQSTRKESGARANVGHSAKLMSRYQLPQQPRFRSIVPMPRDFRAEDFHFPHVHVSPRRYAHNPRGFASSESIAR